MHSTRLPLTLPYTLCAFVLSDCSAGCWWGKAVVVYGAEGLKKDHPVIAFLASEGRAASLQYFKDGFEALQKAYPCLCSPSLKANAELARRYPSQILPGLLYLGDWEHAAAADRLKADINVRRIITVHNHPDNLKPPGGIQHLKFELPDVESADIAACFQPAFECIEGARAAGHAVLVHCGAGVSRSATLVMMYLMRSKLWSAKQARGPISLFLL